MFNLLHFPNSRNIYKQIADSWCQSNNAHIITEKLIIILILFTSPNHKYAIWGPDAVAAVKNEMLCGSSIASVSFYSFEARWRSRLFDPCRYFVILHRCSIFEIWKELRRRVSKQNEGFSAKHIFQNDNAQYEYFNINNHQKQMKYELLCSYNKVTHG